MSELSDPAKALLREASAEHTPSAQQLRALDEALSRQLGTALAAAPLARPELAASKGVLAVKATLLKVAGVCTLAAASIATVVTLQPSPAAHEVRRVPAPIHEAPPRDAPSKEKEQPRTEPAREQPRVEPARRPRERAARRPPPPVIAVPAPVVERVDELSAEVELVRGARALLAQGRASEALGQLDVHTQRFAHGALQEEQLALRALCLCALGQRDAAREAARRLAVQAPHSPQLARLAHSCAARD